MLLFMFYNLWSAIMPLNDSKGSKDLKNPTGTDKFFEWSYDSNFPAKVRNQALESEALDVRGSKAVQLVEDSQKAGDPSVRIPFQLPMFIGNYGLSSNQGIKRVPDRLLTKEGTIIT